MPEMHWSEVQNVAAQLRNMLRAVEQIDAAAHRAAEAESFVAQETLKLAGLRETTASLESALRTKEVQVESRLADLAASVESAETEQRTLVAAHESAAKQRQEQSDAAAASRRMRQDEEVRQHQEHIAALEAQVSDLQVTVRELERVRDTLKSKAAAL